jgi:hypothetical protein
MKEKKRRETATTLGRFRLGDRRTNRHRHPSSQVPQPASPLGPWMQILLFVGNWNIPYSASEGEITISLSAPWSKWQLLLVGFGDPCGGYGAANLLPKKNPQKLHKS